MKLKSHNMNVGASIRHLDVDGSLIKEYYYPTSNNGPEPFIEAKVENENGEVTQHEKYPFKISIKSIDYKLKKAFCH